MGRAKKRDDLLEALYAMNQAFALKAATADRFTGNYCGVSMRAVNRPLVIMPELLTPEEESYFLPYVFNPNRQEARTDYLDWHGGRLMAGSVRKVERHDNPRVPAVDKFCTSMQQVGGTLAGMGGTEGGEVLVRMGISLRLNAC